MRGDYQHVLVDDITDMPIGLIASIVNSFAGHGALFVTGTTTEVRADQGGCCEAHQWDNDALQ